jgi:hypothetical protein
MRSAGMQERVVDCGGERERSARPNAPLVADGAFGLLRSVVDI